MKKTTYIIIGVLVTLLLMAVGIICYIASLGTRWEDTFYKVGGELKTIVLPEAKWIHLIKSEPKNAVDWEGREVLARDLSFRRAPLTVTETAGGQASLTLPSGLERFLSVQPEGDTLRLFFSFPKEPLEGEYENMRLLKLEAEGVTLAIPQTIERVDVDVYGMETTFRGLQRESFAFFVCDKVKIESSQFTNLYPASSSGLSLVSGSCKELHLNVDVTRSWKVDAQHFSIDTEYLSGAGTSYNTLRKGECRRVVWQPKSKDAELVVTLETAVEINVAE